jgi:hypothetical protein
MSSELRNNFAIFSVCLVWEARGYAYSTAMGSEEVRVRIMAYRVVVGKKPANKIGRLNIGEIAAVAAIFAMMD